MSTWNEITDEDIEVDFEMKEINLLVGSDDGGNIYSTLTFKQIHQITVDMVEQSDPLKTY